MLDGIVSFIVNNIFIVIFLVALLSSIAGKGKQGRQGKPGAPSGRPMPTFGGGARERKPPAPPVQETWEMNYEEQERREQERRRLDQERQEERREEERLADERRRLQWQEIDGAGWDASNSDEIGGSGIGDLWSAAEASRKATPNRGRSQPASPAQAGGQAGAVAGTPGHEELVKAVIWSEILGPPRSKRPLRR